jgi:hypothetical protein
LIGAGTQACDQRYHLDFPQLDLIMLAADHLQ